MTARLANCGRIATGIAALALLLAAGDAGTAAERARGIDAGHGRIRDRGRRVHAGEPERADRTVAAPAERPPRLQWRLGSRLRARHEPVGKESGAAGRPGDAAAHDRRAREHQELRPGERRRLHRHVHALRPDALLQRAVSDPDHADRQARRVSVRAGHVVPRRAVQGRPFGRARTRRGSGNRSRNGTATRWSSTPSASMAGAGWTPAGTRTATSCTSCRRSGATMPDTSPTR